MRRGRVVLRTRTMMGWDVMGVFSTHVVHFCIWRVYIYGRLFEC